MSDPTIICPECQAEIKLNKALASPMIAIAKKELKERMDQKESEIAQRELELKNSQKELNEEVTIRVETARKEIAESEKKRALNDAADLVQQHVDEVEEVKLQLAAKDEKLEAAQLAQAEALRARRELDEEKREMDLTVEKKIREGLDSARSQAMKDAEDRMSLQVREKEETIESMKRQIDELRRKAEQGSQQLQGEVQELQLEELLKEQFQDDDIVPVPKGVHGGDIIQGVRSPGGRYSGAILWESKRTKTWSAPWLTKLRDDQRAAKADVAVLVSQALPKGLETFDLIDGVWVCGPTMAGAMATVLRQGLLEVANSKLVNEGMQTKAEEVYEYLTGPNFKRRVEAIVEAFSAMKSDLDKERKVITKQWTKREVQIERVMQATVGMYGELEGIAGQSIQEVEGLDMKALQAKPKKGPKNADTEEEFEQGLANALGGEYGVGND